MFDIIAIIDCVRKAAVTLPSKPEVHVLLENVMGISRGDALDVATEAAVYTPVCMDAKEASWAPRKLLFWLTWKLQPGGPLRAPHSGIFQGLATAPRLARG